MAIMTRPNEFLQRLIGAAALNPNVYEDVEADQGATGGALLTVVLSSVAAGIGARGLGGGSIGEIGLVSIAALLLWAAWALLTAQIGTRLMPQPKTRSDVGELLRTLGFATAPGCLRILGVIPGVAAPVFGVTAIWMLATMVVAVRQALDYDSTLRAVAVCGVGWVLAVAMAVVFGLMWAPPLS